MSFGVANCYAVKCVEHFTVYLMNSPTKRLLPEVEVSEFAEFMDQKRAWQHDPQIWVGRILCFIALGRGERIGGHWIRSQV